MKISKIEIIGLNDFENSICLAFNDDINIITGQNGSGKTTILKLIWYCISANIERAVREIPFKRVIITTSEYVLSIEKSGSKSKGVVHVVLNSNSGEILLDKKEPIHRESAVEEANQITVELLDTSIFFPTFRRIEGGFSMMPEKDYRPRRVVKGSEEIFVSGSYSYGPNIQEALEYHANKLSVKKHKFVSSISTVDIEQLVVRKHNDATTKVNEFSKVLSENIFLEIKNYRSTQSPERDALKDAVSTLDKINQDVTELEQVREDAFKSLTVLSEIIVTIFKHKGIRINPRIILGDIEQNISSDSLSAGEKQMLSFLCYNALYSNCPFFIDEPELSLHVDWQRILIGVMVEQKTNNQFFIATHSPFIYTQYEDKEIMVGFERGNSIAE
ncbi:AAA family ATPase [Nodosilinea sp. FACHB-131]|uniref:AAA family ATPase n=1 Tax=Cyanophyceae TaxID=3028117 RepID=UPI001688A878|nr:ATP-binding protein [Nodosilinea sp. FACHB-131]MBD1876111.1 AAA family ATPase [Nodosilinea sp. FACHB-131]